jgi:hypothetical protein
MTTLVVRHTVENYDTWKNGFDEHEKARRAHSAQGHRVLRDGNAIEVLIDFPSAADASAFASDPALKDAMAKAGVVGAPDISVRDSVEEISY